MKPLKLVMVLVALFALLHCGDRSSELERGSTDSTRSALCTADWSPTWQQGSGANEWWIEYVISGDTVASAYLEIPGVRNVTLGLRYGKWSASTARIPTGTQVVVHATTTSGAAAQTAPFGYLVQTTPSTDPCTTSGGGGGATDAGTGACFAPTFSQGSGANEWWVEYSISGDISSAYLQVVGGQTVTLSYAYSKWRGGPSAQIPTGTSVYLHAVSTSGQIAESQTFRYLVDLNPPAKSCSGTGSSGGGGTTACSFDPSWQQGSGANEWWVEYVISGSVSAASLIVGSTTVTLSLAYGKWRGSPPARIPTGTSVYLHAVSTAGEIAETSPFQYLVDLNPVTKPCMSATQAGSGLDTRPSNTTCLAPAQPPAATTSMIFTRVFPNITAPEIMQIIQPPGDSTRWFVLNREGKIYSFPATSTATETQIADFTTISGKTVSTALSGGMLGFAFHPNFASNGRLYVTFTTPSGSAYASEVGYLTSTDGGRSFSSYTRIFSFSRAALEWNGGGIAFGKDGYLYLGFGASDSDGAQFTNTYFGKVLRLDVDHPSGGRLYGIPSTNPFYSGGGLPEIYAWGFRQPWRISFDRATGDLWAPDIGQSSWEEVNRIQVGKNYGWPCREGANWYSASTDPSKCPSTSGLTDPITEYAANGGSSAIGGYMYRGSAAPNFVGTYVYGDQVRQVAYAFRWDPSTGVVTNIPVNEGGATIDYTSFAEDNSGEVYATSVFSSAIYKLVPAGTGSSTFPDMLSKTGCFNSTNPTQTTAGVIPYRVNAPLWSDGLDKERGIAMPNGTTIGLLSDGDFTFPIGTVLVKTFSYQGKRIETRLFMRHGDGSWAGYSYEWNDAQTDAALLPGSKTKSIGDRNWTFPSRSDCMRCHTAAANFSLGPELGQLNGDFTYTSTGRTANQLKTLAYVGMFASPLPSSPPAYPAYDGTAPVDTRARSYLHANCSNCHRPNGGAGSATMDLRFATPFASTNTCNAVPMSDENFGSTSNLLIVPGSPSHSIVSLRMHTLDTRRMPPLGTAIVDSLGTSVVDSWISGLTGCP